MRVIFGLILALYVGTAEAHVSAVPFPDVGSLRDVVEVRFPRGIPLTNQIYYNIVTAGAQCTGIVVLNTTVSIASGTKNLNVPAAPFQSGDVGKYVVLTGAGAGGGTYTGTIATFTDAANVVLSVNAGTTVSAALQDLTFGFDDAPYFKTFNTWAKANQGSSNQVILTIPSGRTCWMGTAQTIAGNYANSVFAGINNLIVEGTGAGLTGRNGQGLVLGSQQVFGDVPIADPNGKSARLQTVLAGSDTVTLTATSYSSGYGTRFSVGDAVMISGLDLQSGWNSSYGAPSNFQFFDYRKITAVCVNTTGCVGSAIITLDRPLSNDYRADWPIYSDGTYTGVDMGGPATIFILNPQWDMTVEYRGLTLDGWGQTYAKARNVTFRNVTWIDDYGTVPTMNETFSVYNSVLGIASSPGWEIDKNVGTLTMDSVTGTAGGVVKRIDFQSSSVNQWVVRNSNFGLVFGTPKSSQISDTHFNVLRPGAWTNGVSTGTFSCIRCDVTTFDFDGGLLENEPSLFSMSGGVISYARNAVTPTGASRVWVPGGNVYWRSPNATIGLFQSQTVTQSGANVDIQTNEAGGFPALSGFTPQFVSHPAPRFTCDACTGDVNLVGTNIQSGATAAAPLGQFAKRTYNVWPAFSDIGTLQVRGRIVSLSWDVTTAYNGTGAAVLRPIGPGGLTAIKQSNWTSVNWLLEINLKQTGLRGWTPAGGFTCNGVSAPTGCSGDNVGTPFTEAVWVSNGIVQNYTSSAMGAGTVPVVTAIAITDQGVVP